jgi:uroporphyrinogen-III synthase
VAASSARGNAVGPLAGWNIIVFEARERLRLTEMLDAKGAQVTSYPILAFRDPPELGPIDSFVNALANREFDIVVLLTGEGVKRVLDRAKGLGLEQQVISALGRTRTVTRGPKPARALREVGVLPTLTAEVPTTDGVIETLRTKDLRGSIVGVQLYPRAGNGRLLSYLRGAGADVRTVMPYVYENALGESSARELVTRLGSGEIDAVAFTARAQVERLFDLVSSLDLRRSLDFGLNRTRIAALGPVVASSLRNRGHRVTIVPARSFFMKSMVQEIVKAATNRNQPGDERKPAPRMKNVNGWR